MKTLVKLALFAGAVAFGLKLLQNQKAQWMGLTESELRTKIESRIPDKVPEEKRSEIVETVVAKMHESGVLADEDGTDAAASTEGNGQVSSPAAEESAAEKSVAGATNSADDAGSATPEGDAPSGSDEEESGEAETNA